MSSLSTLFGDRHLRDPKIAFDKILNHQSAIYNSDQSGKIYAGAGGNFFTNLGAYASEATADTYVTIVDVTGKGFLFAVVGPCDNTNIGCITTVKITIDGILHTITGGASTNTAQRLVVGPYCGYKTPSSTYLSEHVGFGSSDDFSPYSIDANTARYDFSKGMVVPTQFNGKSSGLNSVRFDVSLKVEIKMSTADSAGVGAVARQCGASYKLDA